MNKQDSVKPSSDCDELASLLPAYSAGALNPEEVEHVKILLKKCPDMQSEADEYATLMAGFYENIEPVPPPPDLHTSLMKKLHEKTTTEQNAEALPRKDQALIEATRTDTSDDQVT